MKHCINEGRCPNLLAYIFNKNQFQKLLFGYSVEVVDSAYSKIVDIIIGKINGVLFFSGNELVKVGNNYIVKPLGEKLEIKMDHVSIIDREYIKNISTRALEDVDNGYFDSTITKSRTLLEEVFCCVIEQKGDIPSKSGKINQLYKQVKGPYNMHTDKDADKRINTLLSGFEKVVSSIAEMRNKDSDSHRGGANRIIIRFSRKLEKYIRNNKISIVIKWRSNNPFITILFLIRSKLVIPLFYFQPYQQSSFGWFFNKILILSNNR